MCSLHHYDLKKAVETADSYGSQLQSCTISAASKLVVTSDFQYLVLKQSNKDLQRLY